MIRFLSSPPTNSTATASAFSFPLTLRLTRVIFLLLKQFSDLLALESEVFLTMFVRVVGPGNLGEGEGGHPGGPGSGSGNAPLWMRVLALEIFRGLCGDSGLMVKFYQRYDATAGKHSGGGSKVFNDLMTALNRLATEKPQVLGTGAAVIYGSSLQPILTAPAGGQGHHSNASTTSLGGAAAGMVESAMEMGFGLAAAAGSVVGSHVGAGAGQVAPGLSVATAGLKLQCIDQLDKAEAPPIPETYIFLLALQCLVAVSEGFANQTLPTAAAIQTARKAAGDSSRAPAALEWAALDKRDAKVARLGVIRDMAETAWPALLASFSFLIATALDDDLFADVVAALQNFTSVGGVLGLATPREAFLTSLCKFAIPPAVVSYLAAAQEGPAKATTAASVITAGVDALGLSGLTGAGAAHPVGLSARNLACLKALLSVANYLAGSLDATWFAVFETLQNADFVLRTHAARAKKRQSVPTGPPATPPRGGGSGPSPLSPAKGEPAGAPKSVLPTEQEELAIQASIAKLFDVSKALDDGAFKWFVGSLCRLNGEMIGIPMLEDGAVANEAGDSGLAVDTGGAGPSGGPGPGTLERVRRRSSGISTMRTHRLGDKSFGVSKLGVVSLLNIQRLIYREPSVGWDTITSHLLLVQHYTVAPTAIRLQAAEVLGQILVAAPKNLAAGGEDLAKRVQTQVLVALVAQAEPALRTQTATDIEIRRMALDSLLTILETNGHAFVAGWERIFHVLRTACPSATPPPPPSPMPQLERGASSVALDTIGEGDERDDDESVPPTTPRSSFASPGAGLHMTGGGGEKAAKTPVLVRTSFPSLQLICTDFLGALSLDELRDCVATLAEFGKQADDVNVALTAGGLLWSVSDHLQAKRNDSVEEEAHGDLWMYLLHQLLSLCDDRRQEVRDGAVTTIFRSISLYGSTLSAQTWDGCMWQIVFPLVESISTWIAIHNRDGADEGEEMVSQPNGPPIPIRLKQWDDTKTLALKSMGNVVFDYLPIIVKTDRYEQTWVAFVGHLKQSFVEDRAPAATAAMQALDKVLGVSLPGEERDRIASSWEVAWAAWDEIGDSVACVNNEAHAHTGKTYTQLNLEAYVRVALPIYTPPYITFDLVRIERLLAVLKVVLTFQSQDSRPDVDSLTPLQAAVLEVVAVIKLEVPGAASAVLSDLAEYITLAFTAAFTPAPSAGVRSPARVTYVALAKEAMPHVLWLFQRYGDDPAVYQQGAVERMLGAYALPMRLKHECPQAGKYSKAEPLWRTATVSFLKAVRDVVPVLVGGGLGPAEAEPVWAQVVEGFRGALLADGPESEPSIEDRHEEENFDLALLVSLEQDVLPYIGAPSVPDELVRRLGKTLQAASRLYELDLPNFAHLGTTGGEPDEASSGSGSSAGTRKETRFEPDFDVQAAGETHGTTAEVVEVGRERFAYWSFEMLFAMCEGGDAAGAGAGTGEVKGLSGAEAEQARRRVAALVAPGLVNRCKACVRTYVADARLRGKMPFPRVRQEELVFVLQSLLRLRLAPNTLFAAYQADPSAALLRPAAVDPSQPLTLLVRSALLRSPVAHVYEVHSLLTDLLSLASSAPSVVSAYVPYRRIVGAGAAKGQGQGAEERWPGLPDGFKVGRVGREEEGEGEFGQDVVGLCLRGLRVVGEEAGVGM